MCILGYIALEIGTSASLAETSARASQKLPRRNFNGGPPLAGAGARRPAGRERPRRAAAGRRALGHVDMLASAKRRGPQSANRCPWRHIRVSPSLRHPIVPPAAAGSRARRGGPAGRRRGEYLLIPWPIRQWAKECETRGAEPHAPAPRACV